MQFSLTSRCGVSIDISSSSHSLKKCMLGLLDSKNYLLMSSCVDWRSVQGVLYLHLVTAGDSQ